jgi:uridine kinase
VHAALELIGELRHELPHERALLVALSGIDGSGKGYMASRLARTLEAQGLVAATIHADDWLHLPAVRFGRSNAAEHFYRHAFRVEEMFAQLVEPLRCRRSIDVEVDCAEETAARYRRERHVHRDVDVILLEGIFLLKREHAARYDARIWIDCSFETALERAVARSQEGLGPQETIAAYRSIYFPAQRIHFERDEPQMAADCTLVNDPRCDAPAHPASRASHRRG